MMNERTDLNFEKSSRMLPVFISNIWYIFLGFVKQKKTVKSFIFSIRWIQILLNVLQHIGWRYHHSMAFFVLTDVFVIDCQVNRAQSEVPIYSSRSWI